MPGYQWIKSETLVARMLPGGGYRLERHVWDDFLERLPTSQPCAANDDREPEADALATPAAEAPASKKPPAKPRVKGMRDFFANRDEQSHLMGKPMRPPSRLPREPSPVAWRTSPPP